MTQKIEETPEVKELLVMQNYLRERDDLQKNLVSSLKNIHPELEEVSISETSLSVKTKKHSLYVSLWSDDVSMYFKPEPTMSCDGKMELPDTVEEFKQMKQYMEDDKNSCIGAYKKLFPIFLPETYNKLKNRYEMNREQYENA